MFPEVTSLFLADFGVPATFGSAIAQVILDAPGEDVLGSRAISTAYRMTFATADLPGLVYGSTIVVDGATYKVKDVMPIDDGVFSTASLQV